jgi:hypothetical protein
MLSVLVGGGAMMTVAIGHLPLAVRAMIEAGPIVFLAAMARNLRKLAKLIPTTPATD